LSPALAYFFGLINTKFLDEFNIQQNIFQLIQETNTDITFKPYLT